MPKPAPSLTPLLLLIFSTTCIIANNAVTVAGDIPLLPPQEDPTPASPEQPASFPGEWQLLHASIGVSAMHMQLLPGDFVLMFDRTVGDFFPPFFEKKKQYIKHVRL
ncbi:unnamed protein product [Urochloa humidicola]